MIGYQYDADGNRIGKGIISSMSCDSTTNGYSPTTDFVLDQSGGQMTEVAVGGGAQTWVHTNVTANGALIATYDTTGSGLHFYLNDALGSRRVQTDAAGFPEQTCQSLPFGDQLYCNSGSLVSPTEHHFTGKERDTESGLDYFGARYYGSSMGRFMSPDWAAKAEPVPYAKLDNPQSLNLYAYMQNNPLRAPDLDGHDDYDGKVHVTSNSNGTKTATQGTQTTATTSTKDANGNVTSTTTTTTKTMTTVTLDAHGDVAGGANAPTTTTTTSSQTTDASGKVTGSTSSTSTASLDEHSSTVSNIQGDAKGLLQMNVTDLVPKTFAPKILDHFHITGQDVIDGVKAFQQGARDASALCNQGVWCNH